MVRLCNDVCMLLSDGKHYFRKNLPSDSERKKETKIMLPMLKRYKTLASLNYFDSNIKNLTKWKYIVSVMEVHVITQSTNVLFIGVFLC